MNSKPIIEQPGEHGRFSDAGSYLKQVPKCLSREDESEFNTSAPSSNAEKTTSTKPTIEEPGEHGRFSDAGSYFKHVPKFLFRDDALEPASTNVSGDALAVKSQQQQNLCKHKSAGEARDTNNPEEPSGIANPQLETFPKFDSIHHASSNVKHDAEVEYHTVKRQEVNDSVSLSKDENIEGAVAACERQNETGKQQHRIWTLPSHHIDRSPHPLCS